MSEVLWAGRTVPVKNELVRVLLVNIEHNAAQLVETTSDEHKLSLYETMMKSLVEAQQILRDEFKDDPVSFHHTLCTCVQHFEVITCTGPAVGWLDSES